MPRRIVTSDDEDRASNVPNDQTDENGATSSGKDASLSVPRTRKRARVSAEGTTVNREGERRVGEREPKENLVRHTAGIPAAPEVDQEGEINDEDHEVVEAASQVPKAVTLPRDIDGHVQTSFPLRFYC